MATLNGIGKYSVLSSRNGTDNIQPRVSRRGRDSSFVAVHSSVSPKVTGPFAQPQKVEAGIGGALGGLPGGPNSGLGGFQGSAAAVNGIYQKQVLDDFINHQDEAQMRITYRDIYNHDAIAGSAVDLMSNLPFSPFTLSGLPTQDMLQTFASSTEALNVQALLPELSVDYQTMGVFIGVLNWDADAKKYSSIMPQNIDFCAVTPLPIYGQDPIIDLKIPPTIRQLLNNKDSRIQDAFAKFGSMWQEIASQKIFPLDPKTTLYVPRRTVSTTSLGTSYYRRILSIWLLEKALMRGTIDLAYRRQRSILHLVMGDEEWEPDNPTMQAYVNAFMAADVDPVGAIVATRQGIQTNEIRDGSNFWRYDEVYDSLASMKMRGLGISDSFLNGDSTYSNMETSLSVFLDQLRAYRELITRRVFYQKIFPVISVENDFRVEERLLTRGDVSSITREDKIRNRINVRNAMTQRTMSGKYISTIGATPRIQSLGFDPSDRDIDLTKYYQPKLNWLKTLKPEADSAYLEVLTTLTQAGLPIPLRAWASAGGQSITEIMTGLNEDLRIRKKISQYTAKLPQPPQDPQEQAGQMFQQAFVAQVMASLKEQGKKKRDFSSIQMRDPQTGNVLTTKGRSVLNEKLNKRLAIASSNLAKRDNHMTKEEQKAARKKTYSHAKVSNPAKGIFGFVGG